MRQQLCDTSSQQGALVLTHRGYYATPLIFFICYSPQCRLYLAVVSNKIEMHQKIDRLQCIWRHCNIGSKRVFTTGLLYRWHNCLLTHKLFSSCIQRYLVPRACDWVMSALSAVLLTFSFQFSLLFFNISLTRPHRSHIYGPGPHQLCSILLDNIWQRTMPKIWVSPFLVRIVQARKKTLNWF